MTDDWRDIMAGVSVEGILDHIDWRADCPYCSQGIWCDQLDWMVRIARMHAQLRKRRALVDL